MTATLDDVANRKKDKPEPSAEQKLAEELVARAWGAANPAIGPRRQALDIAPRHLPSLAGACRHHVSDQVRAAQCEWVPSLSATTRRFSLAMGTPSARDSGDDPEDPYAGSPSRRSGRQPVA